MLRKPCRTGVSNRMKRDLVIRALNNAVALRQPPTGCIHHTDRGSQYCSNDYQKLLTKHGFEVSMSGKGFCYDNSMVETFFKSIKVEMIWRNQLGIQDAKPKGRYFNISTGSIIQDGDTPHGVEKAPWP